MYFLKKTVQTVSQKDKHFKAVLRNLLLRFNGDSSSFRTSIYQKRPEE